MRNPQTIGDIIHKANHLSPEHLTKIRREFYYYDIFRLYKVLNLNTKRLFYNNLFDILLTYDIDLLISHRDALMAQALRQGIPNHIILGAYCPDF